MAGLFGGGGGGGVQMMAAPTIADPAPVVKKKATAGAQLAPGQRVPGGPILPPDPVSTGAVDEDEEQRRLRLLAARAQTILGDDLSVLGGSADGAASSGTGDGAAGGGDSGGSGDGSAY